MTCWFEIAAIDTKATYEVANELEITWLTRYPWPTEIVCDRGREFMGAVQNIEGCLDNVCGYLNQIYMAKLSQAGFQVCLNRGQAFGKKFRIVWDLVFVRY